MIEDRNNKIINRFFSLIGLGFVILCVKVVIKRFNVFDTLEILFETFAYLFIIAIWIGVTEFVRDGISNYVKKNGKNLEGNIII